MKKLFFLFFGAITILYSFSAEINEHYTYAYEMVNKTNDYKAGIDYLNKHIPDNERSYYFYSLRGDFLYDLDKRFNRQEAYEDHKKAITFHENGILANLSLAFLESSFHNFESSLLYYKKLYSNPMFTDKAKISPCIINCLYHLGRYEEAKQYFVEEPNDYYYSMIMGMVSDCLGDVALRDTYVNRAFRLDPFRNHDMYIKHLLFIGRFADAERMIPLMKDDELGVVSKQVFQGYIDMTANNMKKAEKTLRQVTKTTAGYEDGWQFLMYYWALANNSVGKVYAY